MLELFRNFLRSPGLKLFLVAFLVVILLLPLSLVQDLIGERWSRADAVRDQVGRQWGQEQVITGPVLVVPYVVRVEKSEVREWPACRETGRAGSDRHAGSSRCGGAA